MERQKKPPEIHKYFLNDPLTGFLYNQWEEIIFRCVKLIRVNQTFKQTNVSPKGEKLVL